MRTFGLLQGTVLVLLSSIVLQAFANDGRPAEEALMLQNFAGFVSRHPDMYHQRLAVEAYRKGDHAEALRHFRIAAKYADKPSQAMVAEMLWKGQGTRVDRALAYAWMDLAAERRDRRHLTLRERYWEALTDAEREAALARGTEVYAEYGDEVAQKRMRTMLRRNSRNVVGSRTGFTGRGTVFAPVPGTLSSGSDGTSETLLISVPASAFYAPEYWSPRHYFTWREQQWSAQMREWMGPGQVDVGGVEQVRSHDQDAGGRGAVQGEDNKDP